MSVEKLIEINKAIDVCLEKLRRKPRAKRNFKRLMRQGERKLLPYVKEWLNESIKEIQAGLPKMKGKTPAAKTKSITDWNAIQADGVLILKPTIFELLGEGGVSVVERGIRKQQRFDIIGVEAVKWANEHVAKLVTEITEKVQGTVDRHPAYVIIPAAHS